MLSCLNDTEPGIAMAEELAVSELQVVFNFFELLGER